MRPSTEDSAAVPVGDGRPPDFEMHLVNPIPSTFPAGQKLEVPIVAVFIKTRANVSPEKLDNVWVFASLLDSESRPLTGDDPLEGQRADSLHVLELAEGGRAEIAFTSLPDLTFSNAGRYRLRLTAIDQRELADLAKHETQLTTRAGNVLAECSLRLLPSRSKWSLHLEVAAKVCHPQGLLLCHH